MRVRKHIAFAAACALLLAAAVTPPAGASFGFNPITLTLDPRSPIGTFTLTNNESVQKIIQIELDRWEQHDGKDTLTKSSDLIVSPPVFTLAPNDRQIIRIGTRTRTGQSAEKAYRIIVSEAPVLNQARVGMSVEMRVNVPVFVAVTSDDAKKPDWHVRPLDAKHVTVTVDNVSATHLHVVRLELQQRKNVLGTLRDGSYVLPGERHEWTVELARPLEPGALSVNVSGDYGVAKFATTATQP
jgi:fimbrial chaperone protein